jgi:hypothetical protein
MSLIKEGRLATPVGEPRATRLIRKRRDALALALQAGLPQAEEWRAAQ